MTIFWLSALITLLFAGGFIYHFYRAMKSGENKSNLLSSSFCVFFIVPASASVVWLLNTKKDGVSFSDIPLLISVIWLLLGFSILPLLDAGKRLSVTEADPSDVITLKRFSLLQFREVEITKVMSKNAGYHLMNLRSSALVCALMIGVTTTMFIYEKTKPMDSVMSFFISTNLINELLTSGYMREHEQYIVIMNDKEDGIVFDCIEMKAYLLDGTPIQNQDVTKIVRHTCVANILLKQDKADNPLQKVLHRY